LVELVQDAREEELDLKFIYNRGSFYIVDAFPPGNSSPFDSQETSLSGLRVSKGEIKGEVGEEVGFVDETVSPGSYRNGLIARKGGYSSKHAQQARNQETPAVFSFSGQLERGSRVSMGSSEITADSSTPGTSQGTGIASTATDTLPLNGEEGLMLSPPFRGAKYAVTDRDTRAERIPRDGYLASYGEVFAFEGEKAVLDARKLGSTGLEDAMEYLDAELKLLVVDRPGSEVLRKAVETGFDGVASHNMSRLEKVLEREERRFMLEKLRELSR
ncbi:MAG: hypothetical protein ABEJ66_03915, partial [Candidatus Nanohaloarchaea archaeon]